MIVSRNIDCFLPRTAPLALLHKPGISPLEFLRKIFAIYTDYPKIEENCNGKQVYGYNRILNIELSSSQYDICNWWYLKRHGTMNTSSNDVKAVTVGESLVGTLHNTQLQTLKNFSESLKLNDIGNTRNNFNTCTFIITLTNTGLNTLNYIDN